MTGLAVHRKHRPDAPEHFFAAEAAGLAWLAEAQRVGGVRVARVLSTGRTTIDLERVAQARTTAAAAEAFGRALALTHRSGAPAFGSGPPAGPTTAWIGRQEMPLGRYEHWGPFYADLRLLPYAREAVARGHLSPAAYRLVERVCDRLRSGDFDDGRPPDRIHGDLWNGNVLFCADGAVLIDPAAHGGAGETDLAMLALFGLPELDRVERAYAETAGLAADWRQRTGLHQLHPVLVHAASHGPSYGRTAADLARRYL